MSSARTPSPASRTAPMAIPGAGHHHTRARSDSTASDSTEGTPPPTTPLSTFGTRAPAPGTSPTSPIMTMLGQTPIKTPTAFPFAKIPFASAVDDEDAEPPAARHARRASMTGSRLAPAFSPPQQERGANVLRRLSLGGTFGRAGASPVAEKPAASPPRAVLPALIVAGPPVVSPPSPKRRRGTMPAFDEAAAPAPTTSPRPRRAPSPMGERILKGHFDSFH